MRIPSSWPVVTASFALGLLVGLLANLVLPSAGNPALPAGQLPPEGGRPVAWTIVIASGSNLTQPAVADLGDGESPRDIYMFRDAGTALAARRAASAAIMAEYHRAVVQP